MKKIAALLALAIAGLLLTGCVSYTASPAVQGKAFVVAGNIFKTNLYNCDSKDGNPECWPVAEEGGEKGGAKK